MMALTWSFRSASSGILLTAVAAVFFRGSLSPATPVALRVAAGIVSMLFAISSVIAFHISSLRCSESHTLRSLLARYTLDAVERLQTPWVLARANRMWRRPRQTQEALIGELTRRHAETEYGRQHRLGEIKSLEDLRKKHPLTTYDHYVNYIQRLADGEQGVFLDEKPVRFGITSGTSGIGKMIPFVGFFFAGDAFGKKLRRIALYQRTGRPSPLQKHCFIYTHCKPLITKSGLPIAAYSYMSEKYSQSFAEYSSPPAAFTISDDATSTYIHMLFAIADPNVGYLWTYFSPQLYRALRTLETKWEMMLEDLATGEISAKIPLDPHVRKPLQEHLRPDQRRASQLRQEFENGFDGIVRRIWPHMVALEAIDILGFGKRILETYGKGTAISHGSFGSTETGHLAVTMEWIPGKDPQYVPVPDVAVLEFIEDEQRLEHVHPKTLLIDEVKVGGRYELVLTTRSGLYRYRNGDIIQVVGFHENCPVFCMLHRSIEVLNVCQEMTSIELVTAAVNDVIGTWPCFELVDWACAEGPLYDHASPELYYMLFVEGLRSEGIPMDTARQRIKFDESLQCHHDQYKGCRTDRIIAMARVYLVRSGTFSEFREYTVSHTSASFNQYKSSRKLRTQNCIEWMMERVLETNDRIKMSSYP